jgi:hypothetical protein
MLALVVVEVQAVEFEFCLVQENVVGEVDAGAFGCRGCCAR